MKKFFLPLLLIATVAHAQELQTLTLEKANQLAQQNYPLIKQKDLVNQARDISIDNLGKGYLPQLTISGQATYQSAVTEVSVPIPGFTIEPLSKDQYKLVADVNQLIYDGGVIKQQKQIQGLSSDVEQQKLEVDLYKLKERVNQVYLSILYIDEQLKQVDLVKTDLETGINRTEAQVNNGVAFKSNLNVLKAEFLKADQKAIELRSSRKGLVETLGLFLNQTLPENIQLIKPASATSLDNQIDRPELKLFSSQEKLVNSQSKMINARNLPKTSLFVQGGYGRPGLNFLKNEFEPYYIGGIRFSWSLSGLYTSKKEKQLIAINKKMIDAQKETFVLNTNTQLKQQQSEIEKLQQLIATDDEIIKLRVSVKDAAKAQLENGVITANDYLREVNAEDQSRQTLITHQILLLQAQINYQTISGK